MIVIKNKQRKKDYDQIIFFISFIWISTTTNFWSRI